ncbi:hypothetical protein TNCV_3512121 [Trichonephila clavipes]|nr:hypothetical protein TNCV_3512121 [Trichonephila clavipes]
MSRNRSYLRGIIIRYQTGYNLFHTTCGIFRHLTVFGWVSFILTMIFKLCSGGLEVVCLPRKPKVAISTPAGVDRFSGCENHRHACHMIICDGTAHKGPWSTVPNSVFVTLGAEAHEQMFRSGGESAGKPPVFSS